MINKILLVDDEKSITSLLDDVLRREGFQNIKKAHNGKDAISQSREYSPDIIILDIMLPDMDGFEVCKQIRQFTYCPILFLSSKNDELDKLLGLVIGGDDYITKPFSPREVVYRIKAQLRRLKYMQIAHQDINSKISIGSLLVDIEANCVYKHDKEIGLTAREYKLLLYLAENANKIISKERLYEQVWGQDSFGSENTMMVHIRHLREKIEDEPSNPRLLVTVKGLGYKLVKKN
ncbi:response regulator transcription factor [Clostridium sp. 'deep sea']|uniref:response regulator transcription factor n=1 Tax=Clostridium sp. 'deep sea' TaxID=2779445 RepID=UPI0018966D59|nr:response regulator transcription factor [Clostridium sp. 'deep sea']QOR35216.1 response regulator transcription factor [Clostridium sp. 'deep sea']